LLEAQYLEIFKKKAIFVNVLDIVICIIGGFCLVRGLFRGIIKEVSSVVGVLVGFYGAYTYYPLLAQWFSKIIADKSYLYIISFLTAFTVLFFLVSFVGVVIKHLFKSAALGWADRILGGAFALFKALLIVSVILVPLTAFLPKNTPVVQHSKVAPLVTKASEHLVALVPSEMKQKFRNNLNALRKSWGKI
jgi:membrane protein required for colicin V production